MNDYVCVKLSIELTFGCDDCQSVMINLQNFQELSSTTTSQRPMHEYHEDTAFSRPTARVETSYMTPVGVHLEDSVSDRQVTEAFHAGENLQDLNILIKCD